MDYPENVVLSSPFANNYGSLDLVVDEDGRQFLRMGDCFGPDFFGPLTAEQVAAFRLLCDIPQYS